MGRLVKVFKVSNDRDRGELITLAKMVSNPFERMKGLIGKREIKEIDALLFKNAPSIHTFFMSFPIDIIFLDRNFKIISIFKSVKPFKIINCFGAKFTIEAKANFSDTSNLIVGDKLHINFREDSNEGQATIEYALIIAVLIVGIIAFWPSFAETVTAYISSIINFLSDI